MKSIEEIIENYDEYELDTFLDKRFSKRFIYFLTDDQIEKNKEKVVYQFKKGISRKVIPWTEENVLKQLKEDLEFGWEKCQMEKGISSELMYMVVKSWCKILENGLEDTEYGWYGDNFFKTVDKYYGFGICHEETN